MKLRVFCWRWRISSHCIIMIMKLTISTIASTGATIDFGNLTDRPARERCILASHHQVRAIIAGGQKSI